MRRNTSAFRHFFNTPTNAKQTSDRSFKPGLAGASSAVGAMSNQHMKRDDKFYRDKSLLALERERRDLWRRQAQTIEIDPPIPRGWVRHWRLTAKAKLRHDASILEAILERIDNPRFHWRRSFEYGKRRKWWMIDLTQELRGLREWEWAQLKWPEAWKRYFRQLLVNPGRSDQTFAYKITREDWFELFVERHFVGRVQLLDPDAERRESEIDRHLAGSGGRHRLDKLLDCRWRRGADLRQKVHARLAARRIRAALRGDLEVEMSRFRVCSSRPLSPLSQSTLK